MSSAFAIRVVFGIGLMPYQRHTLFLFYSNWLCFSGLRLLHDWSPSLLGGVSLPADCLGVVIERSPRVLIRWQLLQQGWSAWPALVAQLELLLRSVPAGAVSGSHVAGLLDSDLAKTCQAVLCLLRTVCSSANLWAIANGV